MTELFFYYFNGKNIFEKSDGVLHLF